MNRTLYTLIAAALAFGPNVSAEPPKAKTSDEVGLEFYKADRKDPRFAKAEGTWPTFRAHVRNQKEATASHEDSLLVFARWDVDRKAPNQILGVEGSFSDEQIIAALKKFYAEWRAPKDQPKAVRPKLIVAQQNWGCGAFYDPMTALSKEFSIDVYLYYPVITKFETPKAPTPNDKRLAEILKAE